MNNQLSQPLKVAVYCRVENKSQLTSKNSLYQTIMSGKTPNVNPNQLMNPKKGQILPIII
jgi:hypothetical protein